MFAKKPIYNSTTKEESTNIIELSSREENDPKGAGTRGTDIRSLSDIAKDYKEGSPENKIVSELDKSTSNSGKYGSKKNEKTVNPIGSNGRAKSGGGFNGEIDDSGRLLLPVLGVDLTKTYNKLEIGESAVLEIKINSGGNPPISETIKMELTKKDENGNWSIKCVN